MVYFKKYDSLLCYLIFSFLVIALSIQYYDVFVLFPLISILSFSLFLVDKSKSSARKGYECHHDLVNRYGMSVLQMNTAMFRLS
jgi:hypothetical protein